MKLFYTILLVPIITCSLNAQIIINELNQSLQQVELFNIGTTTIDISSWQLCNRVSTSGDFYDLIGGTNVTTISGNLNMAPGSFVVLQWSDIGQTIPSELGLYINTSFSSSSAIRDYLFYNGAPPASGSRVGVAVAAGVWSSTTDFFPPLSNPNNSISLMQGAYTSGTSTGLSNWVEETPSFGAANGTALPVELVSFDINNKENSLMLSWTTASEENSKWFEIERSVDGNNFQRIGLIDAQGNSSFRVDYFFEDASIEANQFYYYRLRQVDLDEQFEYSKIVIGRIEGDNEILVVENIYPNPTANNAVLHIDSNKESVVNITIFNNLGENVANWNTQLIKGQNQINFESSNFANGNYIVRMIVDSEVFTKTLIKL